MRNQFKRKSTWIAIIVFVLVAWIAQGLYQHIAVQPIPKPAPIRVQTVRVKEAPMPEVIETVGTLTAMQEIKLKASGALSARIQTIHVPSGSFVKKGTLLLTLVGAPDVLAPFDGYLTDWLIKPGEYLSPGTELVDLVNTDILSLTYRVPEQYSDKLEINQEIEMKVRTFPEKTFKGAVHFVSPIVDKKTFTILLKADVKNVDQNLWPGMSANVRHILATNPNALVVPESALILTLEGHEVLVVSEGKLVRRLVVIGTRRQGRVQILSGVNQEEAVVITRTGMEKEGMEAIPEDWTGTW